MSTSIARFVSPFKYRREQEAAARVGALRQRDGDDCRRCRRPMRFDLPAGHDQGAWVQPIQFEAEAESASLDNLCILEGPAGDCKQPEAPGFPLPRHSPWPDWWCITWTANADTAVRREGRR